MQLNHGFVTDISHFLGHLVSLRSVGCDIWVILRYIARICNTLQHNATPYTTPFIFRHECNSSFLGTLQHSATHYNTMQHTATHLWYFRHESRRLALVRARCWEHLQVHIRTHCNTLQQTTTHCNTLQHTATHCNTLQHTATTHNPHNPYSVVDLVGLRSVRLHVGVMFTHTQSATHCNTQLTPSI